VNAAGLLSRTDDSQKWLARLLDAERAAYERGRADGYRQGYADSDQDWCIALAPTRAAARLSARTPSHAELERRRWGPGGRAHFADPRPGDYLGRGAA
jgi:hypothetical protein